MHYYIRRTPLFRGGSCRILDVRGDPVFEARRELFALGTRLCLYGALGREQYYLKRRLVSRHLQWNMYRGAVCCARVRRMGSPYPIEIESGCGNFELRRNAVEHGFSILLEETVAANVCQRQTSFGPCWELEVLEGENPAFFCTLALAAGLCIRWGRHNEA